MKPSIRKGSAFFLRSMLWSMLLYIILMAAINWDELANTIGHKDCVTNTKSRYTASQPDGYIEPAPVKISGASAVLTNAFLIMRIVSGI